MRHQLCSTIGAAFALALTMSGAFAGPTSNESGPPVIGAQQNAPGGMVPASPREQATPPLSESEGAMQPPDQGMKELKGQGPASKAAGETAEKPLREGKEQRATGGKEPAGKEGRTAEQRDQRGEGKVDRTKVQTYFSQHKPSV